jgi:hypothetical protein
MMDQDFRVPQGSGTADQAAIKAIDNGGSARDL